MAQLRQPVGPADHIRGDVSAPVTLVEYGDYQCPFCAMAHPVVSSIREVMGDDMCFVFRHFPLTEIHPLAEPAAESAELAGAHGHFWAMHDGLYENHDMLSVPLMMKLAKAVHLSPTDVEDVLATNRYKPKIQFDFAGGVRSGVNGTPAFFVNGLRHDGPYDYASLMFSIKATLRA